MKRTIFLLLITLIVYNIQAQFSTMFNDTLRPFGDGAYTLKGICQDDSFYYVLGGVNNYQPKWGLMVLKLIKSGGIKVFTTCYKIGVYGQIAHFVAVLKM